MIGTQPIGNPDLRKSKYNQQPPAKVCGEGYKQERRREEVKDKCCVPPQKEQRITDPHVGGEVAWAFAKFCE